MDAHVVERLAQVLRAHGIGLARRIGDAGVDRQRVVRGRAPGDDRRDGSRIERDLAVERGAGIARQCRPVLDRALECLALRRIGTALEIGEGRGVGRDHAAAAAGFDRHVAEGEAAFHRQRADGAAGELDGMALRAVGVHARDDGERDVLARNAGRRRALDIDAHPLRLLLPDRLRHQDVRDFRRADAEGVGAEGAVRRGVAVAAHDEQARQRQALLGADDVHDALPWIVQAEQLDAVLARVALEIAHHGRDLRIRDLMVAAARRHVMVGDAEGQPGLRRLAAARLHLAEGVEGAFVDVVPVDEEERSAVLAPCDLVRGPELVDEGQWRGHADSYSPPGRWTCRGSSIMYAKRYQVKKPATAPICGRQPCATGSARRRRSRST